MSNLNLRQAVAAWLRNMRNDAAARKDGSKEIVDRAGGYACALYIDLKNDGAPIRFTGQTLARCGGVPSDPQFFRDLGAIDELLCQLGSLLEAPS